MAKKNKRNIKALLAKRAELQALGQKTSLAIPGAPTTARKQPVAELPLPDSANAAALPVHHYGREIWRTLLATAIIAAVLVAVIIIDKQKPFLDAFGATLYTALELGN
jgi:hypothetical protein